jgi:hypothetical protein
MRRVLKPIFRLSALFLAALIFHSPAKAQEFLTASFYPSAAQATSYVAAADFNGDGKMDIALSDYGSSQISILLNKGDGTFLLAVTYSIGTEGEFPEAIQTGDFNGDGNIDIAVADNEDRTMEGGAVTVFLGNGDGTFQSPVTYFSGGYQAIGLAIGDMNGDHILDLVVTNQTSTGGNGTLGVLLGNGDGTFQPALVTNFSDFDQEAVALGDFNKDGKLDAAVTGGNGLEILLGKGNGTFGPVTTYSGNLLTCVAVGDLNNDGKLDVVAGGGISLAVYLGNGDGTFQSGVQYAASSRGQTGVALTDLNNDGKLDVVTNESAVFFGNGDGTLPALSSSRGVSCELHSRAMLFAPGAVPYGSQTRTNPVPHSHHAWLAFAGPKS